MTYRNFYRHIESGEIVGGEHYSSPIEATFFVFDEHGWNHVAFPREVYEYVETKEVYNEK